MSEEIFWQHSSHWGTFTARKRINGFDVRPFPGDPDPSPLLRLLIWAGFHWKYRQARARCAVAELFTRKEWRARLHTGLSAYRICYCSLVGHTRTSAKQEPTLISDWCIGREEILFIITKTFRGQPKPFTGRIRLSCTSPLLPPLRAMRISSCLPQRRWSAMISAWVQTNHSCLRWRICRSLMGRPVMTMPSLLNWHEGWDRSKRSRRAVPHQNGCAPFMNQRNVHCGS